ncbi:hypothetical protein [Taibaiella koreensis]|uniref:hypothetical protein n=1 Tax=Taibaiella koreensis TaxID=1268548 RepID=UPI000E59D68C|nr:hypothetical protein [Taibaiella koreensis]
MKKYIAALGIIGISLGVVASTAQKPQPGKKTYKGKAFLAGGKIATGKISKKQFDSLIAYPLAGRDTANNERPVVSFMFTYAERAVYEDSTGRPRIMADYYGTESTRGKLTDDWVAQIRSRSKQGDTAFFFDIKGSYTDSSHTRFPIEPITLIITE